MMLHEELRRRLLVDRGVHVTEACDRCGTLLGEVRYMRRGEPGVWCSVACRGDWQRPGEPQGRQMHRRLP